MDDTTRVMTDDAPDWFYPEWASTAPGGRAILVLDTDSALGRYSLEPKAIGLKDLARIHGHLCDGLVISFVEIKAVLDRLFSTGCFRQASWIERISTPSQRTAHAGWTPWHL